ncbi:RluA family pseudouridine synthase [Alkalicoccus daliensis]|uniref:Pseudouridine synthase n=1 Tax=Alkalicoccus daliensis TaxID=745820 RepID=A0A1G9ZGX7_9BACI|nr:RluA family pseudouridine synthase [Alkalicoccus daliensis]SDN20415.1 23S rRNA pseudouridine1911/1915/1917 synthase [Alkalicoccus daliensis]
MIPKLNLTWQAADEHAGMKLREFLRKEKNMSRKLLAEVKFEGGGLFLNEKKVEVTEILHSGDIITVELPEEQTSSNIVPVSLPLQKLYEDEHVLVIEKPSSLPVLPMSDRNKPSVCGAVLNDYQQRGWPGTIHIVTRLDRDTSGVMLIAKHRYAHSQLFAAQQQGEISRTYAALAEGYFPWKYASVHAPITRKEGSIVERAVGEEGQYSVTHIKAINYTKTATLLHISLETGRTHQIRVHLSWMGYPLCGDTLYGKSESLYQRQLLHAQEITFPHPHSSEMITCSSPVPF